MHRKPKPVLITPNDGDWWMVNTPEELKIAFLIWRDRSEGRFTQHTKPTKAEIDAIDPTWFWELDLMLCLDQYIRDYNQLIVPIETMQPLGEYAAD